MAGGLDAYSPSLFLSTSVSPTAPTAVPRRDSRRYACDGLRLRAGPGPGGWWRIYGRGSVSAHRPQDPRWFGPRAGRGGQGGPTRPLLTTTGRPSVCVWGTGPDQDNRSRPRVDDGLGTSHKFQKTYFWRTGPTRTEWDPRTTRHRCRSHHVAPVWSFRRPGSRVPETSFGHPRGQDDDPQTSPPCSRRRMERIRPPSLVEVCVVHEIGSRVSRYGLCPWSWL